MASIPQLPAHSVRDAARAVRRLAGRVIHTVTDAILSEFLDLPEFRVIGYAFEKQGDVSIVHLYCEHRHDVALCPRCSTPSGEGHQLVPAYAGIGVCAIWIFWDAARSFISPVVGSSVPSVDVPSPRRCPV